MKSFLFFLCTGIMATCHSQERFLTKTGSINFEASVSSFEPVAATNNSVTAIIDPDTGNIGVLALVKAFRFKNALMEEHFNENYAESFKFPKAVLKGKILEFSLDELSETATEKILEAQLTFHGITKSLKISIQVSRKGNSVYIVSNFVLFPEDFDIDIPAIVQEKVADEIQVKVDLYLSKK
ncbi:MAG TPA: YceI family protein [Flavobacteriaceae bacterium]|nr:YceI family protein [Flavobacteriaceae bacterium]